MITLKKWTDSALIAFFAAAIWLPTLDQITDLDPADPPDEMRAAAPFPRLDNGIRIVRTFPRQFEAYFNDRFGFRNVLVKGHCLLKYYVYDDSGSPRVILGKDDWLFFTGDRVVDCYRGLDPFTTRELELWRLLLEARRDALAERGIPYLFLFVPNKHTVYPEKLPGRINVVNETSRLDQLTAHLRAHSDLEFLDLRDVLIPAKQRGKMYERTGTHWTGPGRFHAYRAVNGVIGPWLPEITPLGPLDFVPRKTVVPGFGLARMLGMREELREEVILLNPRSPQSFRAEAKSAALRRSLGIVSDSDLEVRVGHDPTLPRLMIVGDSFGHGLMALLGQNFSRSVYIRHRFDMNIIEQEEPDLVINELVERYLMTTDPRRLAKSQILQSGSGD